MRLRAYTIYNLIQTYTLHILIYIILTVPVKIYIIENQFLGSSTVLKMIHYESFRYESFRYELSLNDGTIYFHLVLIIHLRIFKITRFS